MRPSLDRAKRDQTRNLGNPGNPINRQFPVVQISLDLTNLAEALEMAEIAVAAGVDWLEAGTPLLLAEGLRAVETLHMRFPKHPIVADLKTMDGGYLEAEMMAKAGASFVVVMGRAHEATVRRVVDAARELRHQGDGRQPCRRRSRRQREVARDARRGLHHSSHRLRRAAHGQGPEPDGRARRGRRGGRRCRCRRSAA